MKYRTSHIVYILQKSKRRLLAFLCMFVLVWCGNQSAELETQLKTGLALYDQGNLEQAEVVFEELSIQKNAPAETLYYLSMVHLALGDLQNALYDIERFTDTYPDQIDGRVTQAYIYYLDGDWEEARQILEDVLAQDTLHEQALLYISLIDIDQADYSLAEPRLLTLLELQPGQSDYLYLLWSMYSDRWFEAADTTYTITWLEYLYKAYLANTQDRDTQTYIWMSLNDLMKYDKAAQVLASVVQKNPTYALSLVHLWASFRGMGREDRAIIAYEKVLELDPTNIMASLELKKLGREVVQIWYATQSASRMSPRELSGRNIRKVWKLPVLVRKE